MTPVLSVDGGLDAQSGLPRHSGELIGLELQAYGHALHDLDPVAGCILRRQERELRPGARTQAGDTRLEAPSGIRINANLGGLTWPHVGQLIFLEIGLNPD